MTRHPAMAARAAHRAGRLREAERLYRRWLRYEPADPEALHGLGHVLCVQARFEEARRPLAKAVRAMPRNVVYLYHYAECLRGSGRLEASIAAYAQAAALAPRHAGILLGLGRALLGLGRFGEAAAVLARADDDPEARRDLVLALALDGKAGAASERWRALRRTDDGDVLGEYATLVAEALQERERWAEAALWYGRALALRPGEVSLLLRRSACLERAGAIAAARVCAREAVQRAPGEAEAWFRLGVVAAIEGDFPTAVHAQERAIALRPGFGRAWYHLTLMEAADTRLSELEALVETGGLDEDSRIDALFALGRLLERRGAYDAAFARWAEANRRLARREPFDLEAHRALVGRLLDPCRRERFAGSAGERETGPLPLLIVGMPRSGTTLLERMLARHPAIAAGGERPELRHLAGHLPELVPGARPFPEGLADLDPRTRRRLAAAWIDGMASLADGQQRYVTDKLPGNSLRLPLVALLAPEVPIVWCRRDPRDVAVSCYATRFDSGLRFTNDLKALGEVWNLHEHLWRRFAEVLPNPMHLVRYEALVADPEGELGRLFAFLGLPFEPACLRFAEAGGAVRTASFFQVRRPLNEESVGRWRKFADHLQPLMTVLGAEWTA